MGSFANSVFSLMLGWMRGVASAIWNGLSHPGSASFWEWLGANWKMIALVLLAVGLVIDLTVYLFRWRPYKVWGSFFHRLGRKRRTADEADNEMPMAPEEEETILEEAEEPMLEEALSEEAVPAETMPESVWPREDTTQRDRYAQALQQGSRRRRSMRSLLGNEEAAPVQEPQHLINAEEAYHRPVYPRKWRHTEQHADAMDSDQGAY